MNFKIESGVPLDTRRYVRWPFARMAIGESFFTELETKRASSAAAYYARRHKGFRFTCRSVTENGRHGVRVWRVKA